MGTGAKEVGVFLGDVRGGKGLFDPVLGFFFWFIIFCGVLSPPFSLLFISPPLPSHGISGRVFLYSLSHSMIDGVLDFPLIWGLWTFFSHTHLFGTDIFPWDLPCFHFFSFHFSSS